jgi:dipeptidyl aminopeptidase/acylaminoacyl peptidase
MRTRTFLRLAAFCLLAFLGLSFIAGVYLVQLTLHPTRRVLSADGETQAQEMAQRHGGELADVAIRVRDGATLRAWTIRPKNSNGSAVLLLHGLSDNRLGMSSYAELLLSDGFSVLMPDARAHGASGGQLATFGLLESDDIHRWLDWLEQNQHPACIFGFAESMGAAQLLQSLPSEPRFCAVAGESPFSSFREIGYDRVGQFFHAGPWLGRTVLRSIVEAAFGYARLKYKLDFEQVSPQTGAAASSIPILLIHGLNDRNIPIRHSRKIAAGSRSVTLWEVPRTDHCGTIHTAHRQFQQRLTSFFRGHCLHPLSAIRIHD